MAKGCCHICGVKLRDGRKGGWCRSCRELGDRLTSILRNHDTLTTEEIRPLVDERIARLRILAENGQPLFPDRVARERGFDVETEG